MNEQEAFSHTSRDRQWRWPHEPEQLHCVPERMRPRCSRPQRTPAEEQHFRTLPGGVVDNEALRRAVMASPDDDAPRRAYAAWLTAQDHEFARTIGAFITAQLRVADAYRVSPRAEVMTLRSWRGDAAFVSATEFRAGGSLRPWLLDDLESLISLGLVGWPQIYRGFVERVGVRALRFPQIAPELFSIAPIRHLVLIGVPAVAQEIAACPHLARVRSLSLPRYGREDELTDDALLELLSSPHLSNLMHLRLVHQPRLTPRAYERVVAAPTLPMLSSFEVFSAQDSWDQDPARFDPRGRSERIFTYDTPIPVARSTDWISAFERTFGYEPRVHPEDYYGRAHPDIEAIVSHPIALNDRIMGLRGVPVSGVPAEKARSR